ncbi:MAG: sulfatase-like hydrolase/transferase [Pseudomonadota bacterium]|nr:sulfatase-like hydrolase/transferase [Pseudomonadota bacterium]
MAKVKNILFIMCDQLRADYLSCMGHDRLTTPNLDSLAKRGVLFTQTFCQAPICGGSRMNFYTGRYAFTHGATWNGIPLKISELTIGDYLKPLGYRVALIGKTHMVPDKEGMRRMGVDPNSPIGIHLSECGFDPYERDDGLWGNDHFPPPKFDYNNYLISKGYNSDNPWHDFANSAQNDNGDILSGWYLRNCHLPARVREEDSETAYMTNRAMQFIRDAGDKPWFLHLSYIKPHWPYIAPSPYHQIYGHNDIKPVNRHPMEQDDPHPLLAMYQQREDSQTFSRESVRANVIPAYMGLIKQIDDHVGRMIKFLDDLGRMDDTLIVFTSDHGDYLGDHWLGEKELFHEESVRIPLIIYDPSKKADKTRGSIQDKLIESIDLLPTFIEISDGTIPTHILEGKSLLPLLYDERQVAWRQYAVSESEYASRIAFWELGIKADEARATMIRTSEWKFIFHEKFRAELFDLVNDPLEHHDLGEDPEYESVRKEMRELMFDSLRSRKTRTTRDEIFLRRRA